jgi:hypothetical protein
MTTTKKTAGTRPTTATRPSARGFSPNCSARRATQNATTRRRFDSRSAAAAEMVLLSRPRPRLHLIQSLIPHRPTLRGATWPPRSIFSRPCSPATCCLGIRPRRCRRALRRPITLPRLLWMRPLHHPLHPHREHHYNPTLRSRSRQPAAVRKQRMRPPQNPAMRRTRQAASASDMPSLALKQLRHRQRQPLTRPLTRQPTR